MNKEKVVKFCDTYYMKCPFCSFINKRKQLRYGNIHYCDKCHNWFKIFVKENQCLYCGNKGRFFGFRINKVTGKNKKHYYHYCDKCQENVFKEVREVSSEKEAKEVLDLE